MKRFITSIIAVHVVLWSPFMLSEQEASLQELLQASSQWTREYLIALSDNLPSQALQAAEKKLLAHQGELGDDVQPYYGAKVAQELVELLKQHGTLLIELTNAIKQNDVKLINEKKIDLKNNATSISSQLSKVNPYINFCELRDMLFDYLALTCTMIADRFQGKWIEDLENSDKVRLKNSQIASYVAQAMTNAFPQKPVASPDSSKPQATRMLSSPTRRS